jgi:nicotinamide-nucleotide amidase
MKKAGIISVGNELLNGHTVDTNAAYLSGELFSIGIPVAGVYTVGDDISSILRAMNLAAGDADVILTTGGLGPTDDDITRQVFAKFLGRELQFHEELFEKIEDFFVRRDLKMPEKNRIQAYIPAGAKAIANDVGTAPGIMAEVKDKLFFVMPGVPSEMKKMFKESVLPELKRFGQGQAVAVKKLKCFGAGESTIAEMLGDMMMRGRNPLINCTVSCGVVTLHIIAEAEDKAKALKMAEDDEKRLRGILGELIYGTGEQSLGEVVGQGLARQHKTIATAESCTGGLLAELITDIPGASRYFLQGLVTYSNIAKIKELGVPAELLEKYGAVSEEVASVMSRGMRKTAGTDFAIGITGIAGPSGGSEQKPVGLVYISLDCGHGCETERFIFSGDREFIRLRAAQTALNMVRLKLKT